MPLPTLRTLAARRKGRRSDKELEEASTDTDVGVVSPSEGQDSETGSANYHPGLDVKLATRMRRNWIIVSSGFFFISVIFLILVRAPLYSQRG